ncbi:MAG: ImmA/IrrE family metallo-endopeptidase [Acetivibrionales bacterium]|jgi:Zn-dependent peptidase ImmA (M78 family)
MHKTNSANELTRLEAKELAEETRVRFGKKGLSDIFDILADVALLIRKPLDTDEISGFSIYLEGQFVVFLNTTLTLGHERFTGAHELYHVLFNKEILKREKFLDEEKYKEEDNMANLFAAEFLMPEDYVKEFFHRLIKVDKNSITPQHIIKLQNHFKVSYQAMLIRLINLGLCSPGKYDELYQGNTDTLRSLTMREGYDIDLIVPSRVTYIPKEYIEFIKSNYERGDISYGSMKSNLEFVGLKPEALGYEYPPEEDY